MSALDKPRAICTKLGCKPGTFGHWTEEELPGFCEKCGWPVIKSCPHCDALIYDLIANPYLDPPSFCSRCGERLRHERMD